MIRNHIHTNTETIKVKIAESGCGQSPSHQMQEKPEAHNKTARKKVLGDWKKPLNVDYKGTV